MSKKKERAYELDLLRGFAIIMMVLMHFAWDLRYEFRVDVFEFLEREWFWAIVHPFFLVIFVGVSGVCCTFSRNNFFRALKLGGVALAFTLGTYIATKYMGIYCLILFNVLHMLAVSMLVYSLIEFVNKKAKIKEKAANALLAFGGVFITIIGLEIYRFDRMFENLWLIPIGMRIVNTPVMADYMPLVPWLGVFLLGALVGKVCYSDRKSLLPKKNKIVGGICAPIEFMGRHSLIVYIVHQPIVYGILYLIFKFIVGSQG